MRSLAFGTILVLILTFSDRTDAGLNDSGVIAFIFHGEVLNGANPYLLFEDDNHDQYVAFTNTIGEKQYNRLVNRLEIGDRFYYRVKTDQFKIIDIRLYRAAPADCFGCRMINF